MTRSTSGAETTLMVSEGGPSAPPENNLIAINDSEIQPPASGEKLHALAIQESPGFPETPTVSCSSPYKFEFIEHPADAKGVKREGCFLKKFICLFEPTIEMETIHGREVAAEMMQKKEEMELRKQQRE